jgi:hypothetical protein
LQQFAVTQQFSRFRSEADRFGNQPPHTPRRWGRDARAASCRRNGAYPSASGSSTASSIICSRFLDHGEGGTGRTGKLPYLIRALPQTDYGAWRVHWQQWYERVEQHLQSTLGLRERNIFSNIVLMQALPLPQAFDAAHNHDLNILYRQLETIRDIITRHSERADQWRIRGLELRS